MFLDLFHDHKERERRRGRIYRRVSLNIRDNPRATIIPVQVPAGFLLLRVMGVPPPRPPLSHPSYDCNAAFEQDRIHEGRRKRERKREEERERETLAGEIVVLSRQKRPALI